MTDIPKRLSPEWFAERAEENAIARLFSPAALKASGVLDAAYRRYVEEHMAAAALFRELIELRGKRNPLGLEPEPPDVREADCCFSCEHGTAAGQVPWLCCDLREEPDNTVGDTQTCDAFER